MTDAKQPLTPGRKLAAQIVIVAGIGLLVLLGFGWWAMTDAQASQRHQDFCLTEWEGDYLDCLGDRSLSE